MRGMTKDIRWVVRSLARRPGFSTISILTLALGIGAATTMFSVLHGVLLKPLPYDQPNQIMMLYPSTPERERPPWSGGNFVDYTNMSTSYEAFAGHRYMDYSIQADPYPTRLVGCSVTADFFDVFGVPANIGRTFNATEDGPGNDRKAVLSHRLWQSMFAQSPNIVDTALELNGESYTIVGVMPPYFSFPRSAQLWTASPFRAPELPGREVEDVGEDRDQRYFGVVARLRDDVSREQAEQEGRAIATRLAESHPIKNRNLGFQATPFHERMVGSSRPTLLVLCGAVALLLIITCANVSSLQLARAASRSREVSVRAAMGAGRGRIARELLTESLILGLGGGALGVLLSALGTRTLLSFAASDLPRADEIGTSVEVLAFSLGISLLSAVFFGLAPMLWLRAKSPAAILQTSGGRTVTGGSTARLRRAFVTAQIALSLTLLVGAGLLIRTLWALSSVDPGFSERQAVTAQIWLPGTEELEIGDIETFQNEVLERARALPGVTSVGAVLSIPVDGGIQAHTNYSIEGVTVEPGTEPAAGLQAASPGYFNTIGIPVLRGRAFTDEDSTDSQPVVVVSEAFADRFLSGVNPIGRRIGAGTPSENDFEWATIVGVVGSTRYDSLDSEPRAEVYWPMAQAGWPYMTLVLRTAIDANSLKAPLRQMVMNIQFDQPVERIVTLEQVLTESLNQRRVNMFLLSLFAGLAVVLAGVGLYGVMNYSVVQRSREIAIRVAVGARPRDVMDLVLSQAKTLLGIGLASGIVLSLVLGRLMTQLLYEVSAVDPIAFAIATVTLITAGVLAVVLPARRATRTDPAESLRAEG